jgi:hypothetical protein
MGSVENMKARSMDYNPELDSPVKQESEHLELPKPDPENITVFTHNLPNKPILPWNHYDSPWEEDEKETEKANDESKAEIQMSDREEIEEIKE